jgi:hypothetical protein
MPLENASVNVKLRLAVMWAVIMFCYLYDDVFMLLQHVGSGAGASASPPGEVKMLAYAMIITPAALMPLLCLVIPAAVSRWVNIALGVAYFAMIAWTLTPSDTAWFYRFIGGVENLITLGVISTAWRWPRLKQDAAG